MSIILLILSIVNTLCMRAVVMSSNGIVILHKSIIHVYHAGETPTNVVSSI